MLRPLFPQLQFRINQQSCFVIMPFNPLFKNVFDVIEREVENYCGLTCVRADQISRSERITNDIWTNINEARFLIADLTGRNPNVYYELGLAHALNKPVILITQNIEDIPFDLREIRYLEYDPQNLIGLRQSLHKYIKECISTIPKYWDPKSYPSDWKGAYVKIINVNAPSSVNFGQPFEITVEAKNMGSQYIPKLSLEVFDPDNDRSSASQGYFSISFPNDVENLRVFSNSETKVGQKGDSWGGGKCVLKYPIAEGFKELWHSQNSYLLQIQAYPKRKGFLWFYVSASCEDRDTKVWMFDPIETLMDIDQRGENVYCGVIEVI